MKSVKVFNAQTWGFVWKLHTFRILVSNSPFSGYFPKYFSNLPTQTLNLQENKCEALKLIQQAENFLNKQKYGEAEPLFKRALQIYEKTHGLEHSSTVSTVEQIICFYEKQGQVELAQQFYQQTVTKYENQLGKDHPKTEYIQKTFQRFKKMVCSWNWG